MPTTPNPSKLPINKNGKFKTSMSNYEFNCEIVNRIRHLRENAGLSKADLSCILGMANNYFCHIENLSHSLPIDKFAELLKLFKIKPQNFFSDEFYTKIDEQPVIDGLKKLAKKYLAQINTRKVMCNKKD